MLKLLYYYDLLDSFLKSLEFCKESPVLLIAIIVENEVNIFERMLHLFCETNPHFKLRVKFIKVASVSFGLNQVESFEQFKQLIVENNFVDATQAG